jgi:hypothetical protein
VARKNRKNDELKEYIEIFFNLLNVNEKKANGNLHPTITYFINGIYIQFDFLNSTHLNKIEIGKEIGNFRSNYKIIFDQLKPKNFLVKQNCWEIDTKQVVNLNLMRLIVEN